MGYTSTTNLGLKKPTALTPETDWPDYITGNFDTIDTQVANRHAKSEDAIPDADATRSIGSSVKRFLNGFFSQITLGGVTRTTWPAAGSGTQSMDDTYNNGSVIAVDNTDEIHKLASGKKFQITNADGTIVYFGAVGGSGLIGAKAGSFIRNLAAADGSVSYTGIGFKPSSIEFFCATQSVASFSCRGFSDGTNHAAIYVDASGYYQLSTAVPIYFVRASGYICVGSLASFDTDGFTITWAATSGIIANGLTCIYLAFR